MEHNRSSVRAMINSSELFEQMQTSEAFSEQQVPPARCAEHSSYRILPSKIAQFSLPASNRMYRGCGPDVCSRARGKDSESL